MGRVPGVSRTRTILIALLFLIVSVVSGCGGSRPDAPSPADGADGTRAPGQAEDGQGDGTVPTLAQPGPGEAVNPLTGRVVPQAALQQRPFLVAIGNNPSARPQAGLAAADLIYEVPAEGGITRYLALYWTGTAEKIGPVRSSRHYFLDLVLEWQAVWVHAGGSPQHYEQVGKLAIPDIDDVRGAPRGVFWRSRDRKPPDNLYTSSDRVRNAIEAKGWNQEPLRREPWRFALPPDLPAGEPATSVTIEWPGSHETVTFTYDPRGMRYERRIGDELVVEQVDGRPLSIANVIVQFVGARRIQGDEKGRLDVDLVGSDEILIFSAGTVRRGKWRKVDRPSPTIYAEGDDTPLVLVPGQTWILIVPRGVQVEYH